MAQFLTRNPQKKHLQVLQITEKLRRNHDVFHNGKCWLRPGARIAPQKVSGGHRFRFGQVHQSTCGSGLERDVDAEPWDPQLDFLDSEASVSRPQTEPTSLCHRNRGNILSHVLFLCRAAITGLPNAGRDKTRVMRAPTVWSCHR